LPSNLLESGGPVDRCSFCKCAEGSCADPCPRWSVLAPCCKWQRRSGAANELSLVEPRKSLVVSSLELGRVLTNRGRIKFRASGTCMYPCIRPGDFLHIDSRDVYQIAVGDIAVYRRGNSLFGHRTIGKGTHKDRTYIITKPDRTEHGDDGPSYDKDVLGVVACIERRGKIISPPLRRYSLPTKLCFIALLRFWEYREAIQLKIIGLLGHIQCIKTYRRLAERMFAAVSPAVTYSLRIPISSWQTHDLYRKLSLSEAKGLSGQDYFTMELFGSDRHRPAATMTFISRPPECPFAGWWVKDVQVRVRYRGLGLEEQLLRKAEEVFYRWGVKELWVNLPRGLPGTGTTFGDLGFREATAPFKQNFAWANASSCELRPLRRRCPA
jgi:GNAT superfamily N-acetyltransferase